MKKTKKLLAVLLALAMVAPIGTLTAYAKTGTFKVGSYTVTKTLNSISLSATAKTTSSAKAEYLTVVVMGRKVDHNQNFIALDMDDAYDYNTTSSGQAGISVGSVSSGATSKYYYETVTSSHGAKFTGYKEAASNLTI